MKLKSPKSKGNRLEYHVRDMIRGYGFKDAYRTPLSGAIKHTGWEADITSKSFPLFIECKNQETSKFLKWYRKSELECGAKPPVIVWSRNNEKIFAFLLFSDLLNLITGGSMRQKIKIPEKPKKLSLEETNNLQFSKLKMSGRKKKSS